MSPSPVLSLCILRGGLWSTVHSRLLVIYCVNEGSGTEDRSDQWSFCPCPALFRTLEDGQDRELLSIYC